MNDSENCHPTVREYINQRNYTKAEQAIRNGEASSIDVAACKRLLRAARLADIDDARLKLDQMLLDPNNFDVATAEALLAQWRNAETDAESPDLQVAEERVRDEDRRQKDSAVYRGVRDRVYSKWAIAQDNPDITSEAVLGYYTEARDIVQAAVAQYPDNPSLQALLQEARSRRERVTVETEAMTSGAQLGDYVRVLKHAYEAREDEMIPVYDRFGNFRGRKPRDAAIDEVKSMAEDYADDQLRLYIGNADEALRAGNARQAQAELAQRAKFDELREILPGLITPNTQRMINERRAVIEAAVAQVETVERIAADAERRIGGDPFGAWSLYQQAERAAQHRVELDPPADVVLKVNVLEDTYAALVRAFQAELDERTEQLNALIAEESYRDAVTFAQEAQREFATLDGVPLDGRGLDEGRRRAEEMIHLIQTLEDQLRRIRAQTDRDAGAAAAELERLEREVGVAQLEKIDTYPDLRSELNLRTNEKNEITRLRDFLDNPSEVRVQQAIEQAERAATSSQAYRNEFDRIVFNLRAHLALLQVDQVIRDAGYEQGRLLLAEYADSPQLEGDIARRYVDKVVEVDRKASDIATDDAKVAEARRLLAAGAAVEAYETLRDVRNFTNVTQRMDYERLKREVEVDLRREVDRWLKALQIEVPFDLQQMKARLELLDEIDSAAADRYRRSLRVYEAVQSARNEAARRNYKTALTYWRNALDHADVQQQVYIQGQIDHIAFDQIEAEKDALFEEVKGAAGDPDRVTLLLPDLISLQDRLRDLRDEASNDRALRVRYDTWLLQATVLYAECTPDAAMRASQFEQAENYAAKLEAATASQILRESDRAAKTELAAIQADAKLFREVSAVGRAMNEVQGALRPDVEYAQFNRAVETWEAVFDRYRKRLDVARRWYEAHRDAVRKQLYARIDAYRDDRGIAQINGKTLEVYAKLLALDPSDSIGGELVAQLPQLAQVLEEEVRLLKGQIFSRQVGDMKNAAALLTKQAEQISEMEGYLTLVLTMVKRFQRTEGLKIDSQHILDACQSGLNTVKDMRDKLARYRELSESYVAQLDGVNIGYDAEGRWERAAEALQTDYDTFEAVVRGEIDPALLDHLMTTYLKKRTERRVDTVRRLVEQLRALREAVAEENFERAHTITVNGLDQGLMRAFAVLDIYKDLTVYDRWRDVEVIGWEDITAFVVARDAALARLFEWARGYQIPTDVRVGDIIDPEVDVMAEIRAAALPPAPALPDWARMKAIILNDYIGEGLFPEAMTHTQEAIAMLEGALEALEHPPLALSGGRAALNYDAARQDAGSLRGEYILTWGEVQRCERLRADLDDARALLAKTQADEVQWKRLLVDYNALTRTLSDLAQKPTGMFSRHSADDKNRICAKIEESREILQKLRNITGRNNATLVNLAEHTIIKNARQIGGCP